MTGPQNGAAPRPDLAILAATSGHSGVDTVIRNLLPEFAGAGLRVDVLAIDRHGPNVIEPPPGVRVVRLGARHVETAFPALVRYLRRERPRAMLSDKDSVNRVALLARWLARGRCRCAVRLGTTVSVNLQSRKRWQRALQRLSIRYLYRRADAVIVPSAGAAADLAAVMAAPVSAVSVLPNPVINEALYQLARVPSEEPWLDRRECPVVVACGTLTPRKDYATLLRAFARLRTRRRVRLVLVGEGKSRAALERLAAELDVAGDIRFAGFMDNPYPLIAGADVFAHSSRWEGLGVVLVEALALGTPVVSTDCPSGPAEILDQGRLGGLVPVGDDAAMAQALARALDSPRESGRLKAGVTRYRADSSALAYRQVLGLTAT